MFDDLERRLSDHAVMRYRRRIGKGEALDALQRGRFQVSRPGGMDLATFDYDGFVLDGEAVFVMKVCAAHDDGGRPALVAVTCLRRVRPSKELRRMKRQEAREVAWR